MIEKDQRSLQAIPTCIPVSIRWGSAKHHKRNDGIITERCKCNPHFGATLSGCMLL
ncbi:MAG: hypothetical protein KAS82_11920 [Bacteroidales bacterium]|nr:hypothetical protein [Bacteroidales bacterium]